MEKLNLCLDEYKLNDILSLFNLNNQFTYQDLKQSMKKLYKLHPDKSGLEPKYFIFFKDAYSILLNIYKFREKGTSQFREDFYSNEHAVKLKSFIKDKNFNKKFNKLFSETFKRETHGYGDWLKETDIPDAKENRNVYFVNRHNNLITKHNDITELPSALCNLDENDFTEDYSNTVNGLQYDDIKKVYSETYIPVNLNDERINKYSSLEHIERSRQNETFKKMSKMEGEQYLVDKEREQTNKTNYRAYALLMKDEKSKKMKETWWKGFNKLCF